MSNSIYGKYGDWKGWTGRGFGQCDSSTARYFAAEMPLAGLWPLSGRRLLELGFGNGEFAQWSCEQGAMYFGIERLDDLVSAGQGAGYQVCSSDSEFERLLGPNSLDAVVAFDVFEHLDVIELQQRLIELSKYLKVGGLIIGRVPSGDSPFSRAIQHGDITHKSIIGSSAICQIAASCELEVVQIREPAFPVVGQGLKSFLRRGLVSMARALTFPAIRLIFLGNARAVLTPNMVFVLRKPA